MKRKSEVKRRISLSPEGDNSLRQKFYGNYPQGQVEEELERWYREVASFIEGLRQLKSS